MKKINKLLSNNWTITLVGILIGGLAGVYLNGHFQVRKEKIEKSKIFERVLEELSDNNEQIIQWDSITKNYFECVNDLSKYVEDGGNGLIMTDIEKGELLKKHAQVLEITDTIKMTANKNKYYWKMGLKINFAHAFLPYNSIAWKSMKNSQYLKYIDFDCITEIEEQHQFYRQTAKNKNEWLKLYLTHVLKINKGKEILLHWQLERQFNKIIIELYPDIKEKLDSCR